MRTWYCPTEETWTRLEQLAAARDELSAQASNTRPWNPRFNLVGLLGEAVYSKVAELPYNTDVVIRDGGVDFPGVDVKATPHWQSPRLLRLQTDPLKAPVYVLVAIDLERRRARVVGYATRRMLAKAPLAEYGHGPTRTLYESDLLDPHGVIPRIFEEMV